jgi:hypothetical protein
MDQTLHTAYIDLLVYVFVLFMIYLVRLWAIQIKALKGAVISKEWTGKDVEGISHITILNITSV